MNFSIIESNNLKIINELKVDIKELDIDMNEIVLMLGYSKKNIPAYFLEIINDILNTLPQYCDIKAGYKICTLRQSDSDRYKLIIDDIIFNTHSIVTSQMKDSDAAIIFLCTIGDGLEKWSKQKMNEGDPFLAFLIDTIASVVVESAANYIHDYVKVEMEKMSLKITNRYSPGYCKWAVSEQQLLFSLLPKGFCGVQLSDSSLMLPIKSISGVIGVGKNVMYNDYLCDVCGVKDCTIRQKRVK